MDNRLKDDIQKAGKSVELVEQQLLRFKKGFPYLPIDRPATVGDGLIQLSEKSKDEFIAFYEKQSHDYSMTKFVPASGAASRMFKNLYSFLEEDESKAEQDDFLKSFFENIHKFAFSDALDKKMQEKGNGLDEALKNKEFHAIVKALLLEEGLNYGNLPKGLLDFHDYKSGIKTPVGEHFTEGENYARGAQGKVRLHFTVSPEHQKLFQEHAESVRKGFNQFEITFSQQKPETDTIAVNPDNTPFYNVDGSILFRPAGHGALLENLNDLDNDIVFIKNIDNVVPDHLKLNTIHYKKALAGLLMSVQSKLFGYQNQLERNINELELLEIENFARKDLFVVFKDDYAQLEFSEKVGYLQYLLHRPIRVCGMVKNTGEPGGGPFWVKEEDGSLNLQIAETSQIDPDDKNAQKALQSATHFNPVDLVCGIKDLHGRKFDLIKYRNPETGFITSKSKDGKELKALELPGLWNGAMSDWITLFVEVPLSTFNPVKTVNDLLRAEHQAG
ncbi:protein of unknown function [Marivirga sericea]|uniref:DUF4301 domain-containing protein n=1 Tax=Marivirga sericea TaxID=1028 RepID=A0A1X7K092_9BACT|nr:DUF4301 family protein [Marivirga sericea]SMG33591.1 protein of unknown function [Marivirga sericea]